MELQRLFQVSIVIRVGLILYGEVQDRLLNVKFTDIDYRVFSDASSNVLNGRSPFDRHTYRYTPIIAWLLTPNHILFQSFGKLLFATLDIIVGVVICKILQAQNVCIRDQVIACGVWLLNPLTVVVSCRGNAESIMALLLLLSLYCIMKGRRVVWGGVLYGTAVHVKLYPIVYALPLTLYLGPSPWAGDHWYKPQWGRLVTKHRVQFIIASGVTFVLLTSLCYCVYGWEYVYEAILYHVGRTDVRHNFSIYFYPLYLTHGTWVCTCIGLAAFVPQMLLVFVIGCKYYRNLPLCVFAQTFAFVTFNKVCTSQYFLWYLTFIPLLIPTLSTRINMKEAVILITVWLGAQGVWLLSAYLLEFHGLNTFLCVWMAGLILFCVNIWILKTILKQYKVKDTKSS